MDSDSVGTQFLRGEPIRGDHRAYAISQFVGALMNGVPDWTEEGVVDACHRLNLLRLQPNLDEHEVQTHAKRAIDVGRRRSWRETELRYWLDQPSVHLDLPERTIDEERQLLLISQSIDELAIAGHSAETIVRECQVLNARYFAPPLDPDMLCGLIMHMLRHRRAA